MAWFYTDGHIGYELVFIHRYKSFLEDTAMTILLSNSTTNLVNVLVITSVNID